VAVLGVAGALSLAGGASEAAVGPAGDAPTENTAPVITLGEEEISDVSLTTFYVFDNENGGASSRLTTCQEDTRPRRLGSSPRLRRVRSSLRRLRRLWKLCEQRRAGWSVGSQIRHPARQRLFSHHVVA
jgi:hypothetical protein